MQYEVANQVYKPKYIYRKELILHASVNFQHYGLIAKSLRSVMHRRRDRLTFAEPHEEPLASSNGNAT